MKNTLAVLSALMFAWASHASPVTLLVDFEDDATRTDIAETADDLGTDLLPNSFLFSKTKLTYAVVDSKEVADLIDKIKSDSDIQSVEVSQQYRVSSDGADFEVPNDPFLPKQAWHFDMIGLPQAWKGTTGKGAVVAVLDTGVTSPNSKYPQMPDLKNTCFVPGYSFVDNTEDAYDVQSHGTHVASTIAESTNNALGGVGIAFGACIMPVKVLSDYGSGSTEDIAEGIRFAADNGANIINMSLGGGGFSQVLQDALTYAVEHNVLVFCAAGNAGRAVIEFPAAMEGCEAISAVGPDRKLAPYSSHGKSPDKAKGIFLAAPGGNTRDFGPDGGVWQSTVNPENFQEWGMFPYQGTSMATPMAAGSAALVVAAMGSDYERNDVLRVLADTTDRDSEFTAEKYGNGLLNVGRAVTAVTGSHGSHTFMYLVAVFVLVAIVVAGKRMFG